MKKTKYPINLVNYRKTMIKSPELDKIPLKHGK